MSIKSKAIQLATKKIKKTKAGKAAIKTATLGTILLGGSFIAYTLAQEGKKLEENKESGE
jgi:hypothetical protein